MGKNQDIADQLLVLKYQSGDLQALNLLVHKWHQKLLYQSYWLVKDKEVAKDIVQESWAAIIQKIHALEDPSKFRYWANRIVHHKSVDWIRKQTKRRQEEQLMEKERVMPPQETESGQASQLLMKAIADLPENQKIILTMFYLREQSIKEIASILAIPPGTVKSRLFTARAHLKTILKNKQDEKQK